MLAETGFRDVEHLVTWLVDRLADQLLAAHALHPMVFRTLYQRRTDVFDDGMWLVAEAMRAAMLRCGIRLLA